MSSIGVNVPVSYVYVQMTDENGSEHIRRMVYPHDGAMQAVNEALAHFAELPQGWRVREVWVHQDQPRRFRPEPVVKRTLEAREF